MSIANLAKGKHEIPEFVFLGPGVLLKVGSRTEGKPVDMNNYRNRVFLKACDRAKIRLRRFRTRVEELLYKSAPASVERYDSMRSKAIRLPPTIASFSSSLNDGASRIRSRVSGQSGAVMLGLRMSVP